MQKHVTEFSNNIFFYFEINNLHCNFFTFLAQLNTYDADSKNSRNLAYIVSCFSDRTLGLIVNYF